MPTITSRSGWSSSFGFILAAIGSAVGLGNIWRFPYVTGESGGAAFLVLYLLCVLLLGIPIMIGEFLIGRTAQRNPVGAFRTLRPNSPWVATGWIGVVSGFVILSYYAVIGGWVLHYICLAVARGFAGLSPTQIEALLANLTGNIGLQIFWLAIFTALTTAIVGRGVAAGIEAGNRFMMPLFFGLLVILLIYALGTDGARTGLDFFLRPRWHKLTPATVLEALGQALFSLSLGMGTMITYGSYLVHRTNIVRAAFIVALGDTLVAILAGLLIFPLVFTFALDPAAGPGLIFRTLPLVFGQLPGGYLVAIGFFILLGFGALTSAISLLAVVCAYFVDERGWSQKRAAWTLGVLIFFLGIPSALAEGFLTSMDDLATKYLLPLGALLIALFCGWALSERERRPAFDGARGPSFYFVGWSLLIRLLCPVAVVLIFLHQLQVF